MWTGVPLRWLTDCACGCKVFNSTYITAEVILAEIGCTVNAFQTAENLASWAGLCPGNYESAGIKKRSNATKGNKYLKVALCRAGISAGRSKSGTFHSFFVKLSQRMPKAKAAVATAHKLLRIVYVLHHFTTFHAPKGIKIQTTPNFLYDWFGEKPTKKGGCLLWINYIKKALQSKV